MFWQTVITYIFFIRTGKTGGSWDTTTRANGDHWDWGGYVMLDKTFGEHITFSYINYIFGFVSKNAEN